MAFTIVERLLLRPCLGPLLTVVDLRLSSREMSNEMTVLCVSRGLVCVGFFATRDGAAAAYPDTPLTDWGVFYGGSGPQLGVQLLGALALGATTLVLNGIGFFTLRALGCLRVPKEVCIIPVRTCARPLF